jgi:sRNA-binding regulator protein Hfq
MVERKSRRPPNVEVVRRPTPAGPTPAASAPVRPSGPAPVRPAARPPLRSSPPRPPSPSRAPPTPPTAAAINALAARERVPARIAKGELEGKMRARIWRKLHPEEARRFDDAYALMAKTPGLDLADAFGMIQSGLTLDQFRARQARVRAKSTVKEARSAVSSSEVDGWLASVVAEKAPLALVLGDRTLLDVLLSVHPVALILERSGRLEKLAVCAVTRRSNWDVLLPTLSRDSRLAQKPVPVAREPDRRPHSDPRPFLEVVQQKIRVHLRNGFTLEAPLRSVGPYDLLLGLAGQEVLVPLHALMTWEALPSGSSAPPGVS